MARGVLDAAFDPEMNPWDNAAIIPCILEAGGTISDGHGETDRLLYAKSLVTSSSPQLHNELLSALHSPFSTD